MSTCLRTMMTTLKRDLVASPEHERDAPFFDGPIGVTGAMHNRAWSPASSISAGRPGSGLGATFTVSLPAKEDMLLPPVSAGLDVRAVAHAGTSIMVVDDNIDAAQMLEMLLSAYGHHVWVAFEPFAALERVRVERPRICILDIGLPGIDGYELARRLRALPETRDAMLIAVTGYSDARDRAKGLEAGFDAYFAKPVSMDKLMAFIDSSRR